MIYPQGRHFAMFIENKFLGDQCFNSLLIQTLKEYIAMLENNRAGCISSEKYYSPNGNEVTIICCTWNGTLLPHGESGLGQKYQVFQFRVAFS